MFWAPSMLLSATGVMLREACRARTTEIGPAAEEAVAGVEEQAAAITETTAMSVRARDLIRSSSRSRYQGPAAASGCTSRSGCPIVTPARRRCQAVLAARTTLTGTAIQP